MFDVWYYEQVENLRKKHNRDEEITEKEINKLAIYVRTKKMFYSKPGNNKKYLLKAENLLKKLTGDHN